jgi:hypothetical protein
MKMKTCAQCGTLASVMYRVQIEKGKVWIFVCKACCVQSQLLPDYKYGGTWKG